MSLIAQRSYASPNSEARGLALALAADVASAGIAAALAAPFVAAIDKSVTMAASGKGALWSSLRAECLRLALTPRATA